MRYAVLVTPREYDEEGTRNPRICLLVTINRNFTNPKSSLINETMKIAYLIVSISLMVAISAYDWRKRQRDMFAVFQDLSAEEVPCLLVKTAVFHNEVLDRDTLLNIHASTNDRCIAAVSRAVSDDTVVKTVSDEAIIGMVNELEKLRDTERKKG